MLDTIDTPIQDLVNLDLDMKKAEIALCVFIERAFRSKITNGGSFIIGTNSRYFKGFIEKVLKKTNILYSVRVNAQCESFQTHIKKPEVFTKYETINNLDPQNHATWAYYLDSCKSCTSKEFTNQIRQFYKKAKKLDCSQLAPVFEISQSYEVIKTILLNKHNEYNFENSTYLLESFVKFYSVKA